jgi:hypothetical protein
MPQIGFQVGGVQAIGSVLMPWMNGDSNVQFLEHDADLTTSQIGAQAHQVVCSARAAHRAGTVAAMFGVRGTPPRKLLPATPSFADGTKIAARIRAVGDLIETRARSKADERALAV